MTQNFVPVTSAWAMRPFSVIWKNATPLIEARAHGDSFLPAAAASAVALESQPPATNLFEMALGLEHDDEAVTLRADAETDAAHAHPHIGPF